MLLRWLLLLQSLLLRVSMWSLLLQIVLRSPLLRVLLRSLQWSLLLLLLLAQPGSPSLLVVCSSGGVTECKTWIWMSRLRIAARIGRGRDLSSSSSSGCSGGAR